MNNGASVATCLGRWRSLRVLIGIACNPITTTRRLHAANGRYVILHYPDSRRSRRHILACVADPGLYRMVASDSEAWRSVNVGMRAFKNHAANRLSLSVTRLRGARHAHYRRLLALPLSKRAVTAMSLKMVAIAARKVETWPRNRAIDLVPLAGDLMQDFAISLFFGDDRARALPIAEMIGRAAAAAWPFPGRAYFKWLQTAPKLERAINDWVDEKRGDPDPNDIFSVLVNSPDEKGQPPSKEIVGGILTFAFGAAFETCQNALVWTLVLLAQHPRIAVALAEEIDRAGGPPSADRIGTLPLLDGVTKEGMRLFPPVPLHFRRSLIETELGGTRIPAGMRVLTSVYLINRDPELYSEPKKFVPQRWHGLDRSPFEYPVFGAGGRMCPGALLGSQMVKIALAAVLSRHRVELVPHARIDHRAAITLTPYAAVPIVLRETAALPVASPLAGSIHELVDLPAAS